MTNTAVRPAPSTSDAAAGAPTSGTSPVPAGPPAWSGTTTTSASGTRTSRSAATTLASPAASHPAGTTLAPTPSGREAPTRTRVAEGAAAVASVLGLGSAVVSLGWGLGSTFLLDTVGGVAERVALERTPLALAGIVAVVALKVVAALLPGWALSPDGSGVYPSARRRVVRAAAWVAAAVLTGYGAVMTVGGVLVTTGVIATAPGADTRAIAWHAYLWDPWFLLWGLAATVALVASRRPARD